MNATLRKIKKYLSVLKEQIYFEQYPIEGISICPCGYKSGHTPPPLSEFVPYVMGEIWGDNQPDRHAWFHFSVDVPEISKTESFQIQLDSCGNHVINRPQFMIYVNGELRQGMDANHTYVSLNQTGRYDIYLYAYTGRMVVSGSSRVPSVVASPSDFSVGLLAARQSSQATHSTFPARFHLTQQQVLSKQQISQVRHTSPLQTSKTFSKQQASPLTML